MKSVWLTLIPNSSGVQSMRHHQEGRFTTSSVHSQVWSADHQKLYAQIQAFAIDSPDALFPFSHRLARDHQWSLNYAYRVIEEYKKFLFLATVSGHPVTPSSVVDEAWHLHLTYTRSYWDDLCAQVLQRTLHHHPTSGGQQQRDLYDDNYSKTLNSYEHFFGYCAPGDIWPPLATRFRHSEQFKLVRPRDYWFIPKPGFVLFKRVPGAACGLLWLRSGMILLLAIGLMSALSMLGRSAIAAKAHLGYSIDANPAAAEVALSSNSQAFANSTLGASQGGSATVSPRNWVQDVLIFILGTLRGWILALVKAGLGFLLIGIALVPFCLIWTRIDSWCPACRRFSYRHVATHPVREPSEGVDGEAMDVSRCTCCRRVKWRFRHVPPSDSGCAGCA